MASSLLNKRLLIVLFLILCFISFQATARTLKERSNITGKGGEKIIGGDHQTFKPKDNNEAKNNNAEGEVFSMDYTPASKKPPIHN